MENEKKKKRIDLKRAGKKTAQAAAGAGLAISLFFGSMFSGPQEIIEPDTAAPPAIVQVMEREADNNEMIPEEAESEEKRTLRARIRARLMAMPLFARLLLLLPAWAVGFAIIWGVSALFGMLGLPVIGTVVKFVLGAAGVFGLVLLGQKLIFPDVPIKQLLSRKNLTALIVSAGVIALAGSLAPIFWKDKPLLTAAIDLGAAAIYLLFFMLFVKKPKKTAE